MIRTPSDYKRNGPQGALTLAPGDIRLVIVCGVIFLTRCFPRSMVRTMLTLRTKRWSNGNTQLSRKPLPETAFEEFKDRKSIVSLSEAGIIEVRLSE